VPRARIEDLLQDVDEWCRFARASQPLGDYAPRSVSAVTIARGEHHGWPPRVVLGAAAQASTASSVNHTVKLPRLRRVPS